MSYSEMKTPVKSTNEFKINNMFKSVKPQQTPTVQKSDTNEVVYEEIDLKTSDTTYAEVVPNPNVKIIDNNGASHAGGNSKNLANSGQTGGKAQEIVYAELEMAASSPTPTAPAHFQGPLGDVYACVK